MIESLAPCRVEIRRRAAQADRGLATAWSFLFDFAASCRRRSRSPWGGWSARSSKGASWRRFLVWSVSCSCWFRCRRFSVPSAPILAAAPRLGSTTRSRPGVVRHREWATSKTPSSRATSTMARDFDLAISGPPLFISMDFIAGRARGDDWRPGVGGVARRLRVVGAPVLAGAWLRHPLALPRERRCARPQHRGSPEAQRHADYAYRLAVDPPAAKELRLFGLADWVIERLDRGAATWLISSGTRPACASGR